MVRPGSGRAVACRREPAGWSETEIFAVRKNIPCLAVLRYGPFRTPIWPISRSNMAYIGSQNSLYCNALAVRRLRGWCQLVCMRTKSGAARRVPHTVIPRSDAECPRITSGGGPARHALRMFGLLANGLKLLKLTRVRDKQTLRLSRGTSHVETQNFASGIAICIHF